MAADLPWQPRSTDAPFDDAAGDGEAALRPVGASQPGEGSDAQEAHRAAATEVTPTTQEAIDAVPGAGADAVLAAVPDAEEYRNLLAAATQVLDRVDRALGQLADGSYGRCSECGDLIDDALLEADPAAQRCAEHTIR